MSHNNNNNNNNNHSRLHERTSSTLLSMKNLLQTEQKDLVCGNCGGISAAKVQQLLSTLEGTTQLFQSNASSIGQGDKLLQSQCQANAPAITDKKKKKTNRTSGDVRRQPLPLKKRRQATRKNITGRRNQRVSKHRPSNTFRTNRRRAPSLVKKNVQGRPKNIPRKRTEQLKK